MTCVICRILHGFLWTIENFLTRCWTLSCEYIYKRVRGKKSLPWLPLASIDFDFCAIGFEQSDKVGKKRAAYGKQELFFLFCKSLSYSKTFLFTSIIKEKLSLKMWIRRLTKIILKLSTVEHLQRSDNLHSEDCLLMSKFWLSNYNYTALRVWKALH